MNADDLHPAAAVQAAQARVSAASPFVARVFGRQRVWADTALASGVFAQAPGAVVPRLQASLAEAGDEAAFLRELRNFRNRELAWLAFRDIAGWADVDETLAGLSEFADAAIDAALNYADATLRSRHGSARTALGEPARPFVLGMGKLGGKELNFSSDIDLIFGYTEGGETDPEATGARPSQALSNEEYFCKLARETGRLLATLTEDGFVFRVDTMLRPFGSVGAAAMSMSAMEDYYQAHGREWERYALIKARPCAGDIDAGFALLRRLRPFIYRRYLDYNALGHLRELKRQIDRDAQARGVADNLKLGPGGIREVEFIVQLFQLTRGGQDARLRDPRLRPVLRVLGESGLLPAKTVRALDNAYTLLRRCENAVQFFDDQQVHALPETADGRAALAAALNAADFEAVLLQLQPARARVHQEFERLFAQPERAAECPAFNALAGQAWDPAEASEAQLRAQGFGDGAERLCKALQDLRQSRLLRVLSEAAQARLRELLPRLLADCAQKREPATTALRVLEVIAAIAGRSTYLSLLHESATARAQLVRLCAASPWISALLARTPALLDTLLDPRLAEETPDRNAMRERLQAQFARLAADDTEAQMELLRRYRQETTLRIAAADLAGSLPLMQVSDRLTWLAEVIVEQALSAAWAQLIVQVGAPRRTDGGEDRFAIIGYGKFGSLELGYGSDLDLVFVYDSENPEAATVGAARSISAAEFFARLGQRFTHYLATLTPAGRAYEIDLQLRPSGNSGLVVSRLESFARYQRESAWTWEHQALLKARPVAGDAQLCAAIDALRAEVLTCVRDAAKLRQDVIDMRTKMRSSLEKREAGRWDVKQGSGGLIDAEFITQYLCLREAPTCPPLIECTDNWRQLEKLADKGRISMAQKDQLLAAERAYRGWLHRRALQQADGLADDADFASERAAVAALWQQLVIGG
jgi:[glutamine synthetase] adenylyltransferase / [glutamine synthetase]-adenylyl-L-tyrosine phosphorylase